MAKKIKQRSLPEKLVKRDNFAVRSLSESVGSWLKALATAASGTLTPTGLIELFHMTRAVEKAIDDGKKGGIAPHLKAQLVTLLKEQGKVNTDKGGRALSFPGWKPITMHPSRTGYDPRKVEARLRALGRDPQLYMVMNISFTLPDPSEPKFALILQELGDAAQECRYEESWTVQTPEREDE